jgi:diguanylate cyclase (GGDEF)-like protein
VAVWYFGKPDIPFSGLFLAFAALGIPVAGTFWFPQAVMDYELLLWLVALVPTFLLAYYRGWTGVALAMVVGMAVLSLVQVAVIILHIDTDWTFLFGVIAAYVSIGLTIGLVSELLHQERARAERLALQDDLTEIPNRRLADLFLAKEFAAAQRGRPLAVVLFDLDGFKEYNDRYGHAAGDAALRAFVGVLRPRTRRMDLVARYGGDEFIAVLSGGSLDGGITFADEVRRSLRERLAGHPFTVSAGVAAHEESMADVDALIAAADRALYQAKAAGRDRVASHQHA